MHQIVESLTAPGKPWHEHQSRLYDSLQFYALSTKFGWTPEQIRSMSDEDRMIYMSLMAGESQASQEMTNAKN